MTIGEDLEVTHSKWNGEFTLVRFEKPDAIYCFKTLDCTIPYYRVSNIVGFTEDEVAWLVQFCRNNAGSLITYSKCGGIANAWASWGRT